MRRTTHLRHAALLSLIVLVAPATAAPRGSMSPLVRHAVDRGRAPATDRHRVVVGLALRNREQLDAFLADVSDPASPRYRHFMTQEEFEALHAPAADDEEAVVAHLRANGLDVTDRFPNRLIVGAEGSVAALERAFGVEIRSVDFRGRRHFAAMADPALPAALDAAVVGVVGLDDLAERRPRLRDVVPAASLSPSSVAFAPADLAAFYDNASGFDGSGETIVIAGAYAWQEADNAGFVAQWALPALPAGSAQVCTGSGRASGCGFDAQNSIEIALDVEYAHASAPGARIINYMARTSSLADFVTMYNRVVTDNAGRIVSTSWGSCESGIPAASQTVADAIFANANAVGQTWLAASGDSGAADCDGVVNVDNPANSPHVIGVGGTTATCSAGLTAAAPACAGYGSETAWSGSGGGVSQLFPRPSFQTGCGVPAGTARLVPDVALEGDRTPGNYVLKGGSWFVVGGTSAGPPQWAGYLAQLDQKAGGGGLGNPGAVLYGLCGSAALHDVTSGSNGAYAAAPGYDMVTGIGTPRVSTLVALANVTETTTSTLPRVGATTTTSTTQPPACPSDGFEGLLCALAPGLDRAECRDIILPRALRVRFDRALALVERAEAARRPAQARRLTRRAARSLSGALAMVGRPSDRRSLGTDCVSALRAMLADGRARAERLAAAL